MEKQGSPLTKNPPCFVRWQDAAFEIEEWNPDDIEPYIELASCGFLVKQTDLGISIAQDYCDLDGSWRRVLHIPKQLIIEMKVFNDGDH